MHQEPHLDVPVVLEMVVLGEALDPKEIQETQEILVLQETQETQEILDLQEMR